ncbi:MAG TPA: DNA methyltransferase [Vicinamibacterales bacterium]|nr:DNA methyltransferase [Vicinamibacterales bacterium]
MMRRTGAAILPFDDRDDVAVEDFIRDFRWSGVPTCVGQIDVCSDQDAPIRVNTFTNEFWTAKQRAAHSLHEISYRACFKPQLPRFFIDRLTRPDDIVYDPFMGRGTTLVEAALMGRRPCGCDVNPLSAVLCEPRLRPPSLADVQRALAEVDFSDADEMPEELLVFYHQETLRQISALRRHLLEHERSGASSAVQRWIRMVAVNRLTGHSTGFFSVYTLPPNQAVSPRAQAKINSRLNQRPQRRDVPGIILSKSRALLRDVTPELRARLEGLAETARILAGSSASTPAIEDDSIALAVTSPPFLDVVDYKRDNWLRCWFSGIDATAVPVTQAKQLDAWKAFVTSTLTELRRILRPNGHIAFEVGEVRGGAVRLEELVVPAGIAAGLEPVLVLVNAQEFTKTANCWGVTNNRKGTNTNRVVLFRKRG